LPQSALLPYTTLFRSAVCEVPVVYVAHTSLAAELPSYGFSPTVARLGALWERALCRRAARTLAVSPALARALAQASGVAVEALRSGEHTSELQSRGNL